MEEEEEEEEEEDKAMRVGEKAARRIPTRSSRYLENKFKGECNTVYLLSNCCGVLVGVAVVFDIVVWFLCCGINPCCYGTAS